MQQEYQIPCIDKYGKKVMSLLQNAVTLKGLRGAKKITALFDSGASYSCIRRNLAEEIGVLNPLEESMEFETADKGCYITAEYVTHFSFYFPDTSRRDRYPTPLWTTARAPLYKRLCHFRAQRNRIRCTLTGDAERRGSAAHL